MKKFILLLFCAVAIGVPVFAMEFDGENEKECLLGDRKKEKGKQEKEKKHSKKYEKTRLVPWNEMSLRKIAQTGELEIYMKALGVRPNADINYKTISGIPQLHALLVACDWTKKFKRGLEKIICEHNPIIDIRDNEGKTILFKFLLGSSDNQVLGFQYFVYKLKASLTVNDNLGNTLFHEAAMRNNFRMMGELLSACSVKLELLTFARLLAATNEKGQTALDIAIEKKQETEDDKILQRLRFVIKDIGKQISDLKKEVEAQKAKIDKSMHATKKACNGMLSLIGKLSQLSINDVDSDGDEYYDPLEEAPPIEEDGSLLLLSLL